MSRKRIGSEIVERKYRKGKGSKVGQSQRARFKTSGPPQLLLRARSPRI